jgi:hypothetical protein
MERISDEVEFGEKIAKRYQGRDVSLTKVATVNRLGVDLLMATPEVTVVFREAKFFVNVYGDRVVTTWDAYVVEDTTNQNQFN